MCATCKVDNSHVKIALRKGSTIHADDDPSLFFVVLSFAFLPGNASLPIQVVMYYMIVCAAEYPRVRYMTYDISQISLGHIIVVLPVCAVAGRSCYCDALVARR